MFFLFGHHFDCPGSGSVFPILIWIQRSHINTDPHGSRSETLTVPRAISRAGSTVVPVPKTMWTAPWAESKVPGASNPLGGALADEETVTGAADVLAARGGVPDGRGLVALAALHHMLHTGQARISHTIQGNCCVGTYSERHHMLIQIRIRILHARSLRAGARINFSRHNGFRSKYGSISCPTMIFNSLSTFRNFFS